LDLLADEEEEVSKSFIKLFSEVNSIDVDIDCPVETQVKEIEERMGEPSHERMLVYSTKQSALGVVLSRRYLNAARIDDGPLKLGDMSFLPDHLSKLPNENENRVLFLAPHCDDAYIAAILLHKQMNDDVFLHSFTFSNKNEAKVRRALHILGLREDDYTLGSLEDTELFKEKETIRETIRELLAEFKPTVVFSVFPKGANFDHTAVAQVAREVILNESSAELIYGYVLQSRNRNPTIFPIFSKTTYEAIMKAFGNQGFNTIFGKYVPFLKGYMHTYSEPILRMIGSKRTTNVYSLPLEAERISQYRIPNSIPDNETNPKAGNIKC